METRGKAIGLLMARKMVKEVTDMLGFFMRTIWYWWKKGRREKVCLMIRDVVAGVS